MQSDASDATSRGESPGEDEFAELLGKYVDRICAGEKLDTAEIRRDHPDLASALIRELETFESIGPGSPPRTLGTLGNYELVREIGRGGMGVVYEARDRGMDRQVALKVLPEEMLADSRAVGRFVKEARIAGKLQHPNIVTIHGMGIDSGRPFFAMEFVQGLTLAQILRRHGRAGTKDGGGPWRTRLASISPFFGLRKTAEAPRESKDVPPDLTDDSSPVFPAQIGKAHELDLAYCLRVAHAFAALADGLQHAHRSGVIHRDIKPSNIILDRQGRLRILDFGLARMEGQESLTRSHDILGTPLYMSPEQVDPRNVHVDYRTDVYSLGATLYEMLVFEPPFQGRNYKETLSQVLHQDPRPPRQVYPRIPRDLETIVLKCLEKDPPRRYRTAEALGQDLRRFARGDPIEARPQSAWEKMARRAWRKKGRILAILTACLLFLTTGLLVKKHHDAALLARQDIYREKVCDAMMLIEYAQSKPARKGRSTPVPERPEPRASGPFLGPIQGLVALAMEPIEPLRRDPAAEALALLDEASSLLPDAPEAPFHRARALALMGQGEAAGKAIRGLLEKDPGFAPALTWREIHLSGRKGGTAKAPRPEALPPASGREETLWEEPYVLAHEALQDRRWQDAIRAYSQLIEVLSRGEEPYLGALLEAHLARGRARLESGSPDEALEDFSAAQALQRSAMEPRLLLAKAYYIKQKPEIARERLRSLHDSAPFKGEAALRISDVQYDFEDFEEALRWAEQMEESSAREQRKAYCLAGLERRDEARKAAEEAVKLDPLDPRAHHALGSVLVDAGDFAGAAAAFQKATELDKGSVRSFLHLAHALQKQKKRSEARAAIGKALELDPRNTDALLSMALVSTYLDDMTEARGWLAKALEQEVKTSMAYNNLGLVFLMLGQAEEAIGAFDQALALDPKLAVAHSNKGLTFREQGKLAEAIDACKEALELDPRLEITRIMLGGCFLRQGDLRAALAEYDRVVEINPRNAPAHFNRAIVYEMMRKPEEAIKAYRQATEAAPDDLRWFYNLGNLLSGLGRFEEAIEPYERVLALEPDHDYALNNLGIALFRLGRLKDAAARFQQAIEEAPESPDAHFNLAGVLEKTGDIDGAIARFEKGIGVLPADTAEASKYLPTLDHLVELLIDAGKPEEAKAHASKALSIRKQEAEKQGASVRALNDYAWTLLVCPVEELRDPATALTWAKKAAKESGQKDPSVLDTLALAYFKTGNVARAVEIQRKAVDLVPPSPSESPASELRQELEARLQEYERALPEGKP